MLLKEYMNNKIGKNMTSKDVMVIGDTIIDHSIYGKAVGLSLETPTMKGVYSYEEYQYGGAANVVNNLLALQKGVVFVTCASYSKYGDMIRKWSDPRLDIVCLDSEKENLVKSRYWLSRGDSYYKVMQLNRGDSALVSETQHEKILSIIKNNNPKLVVLVDYRGGMFDNPMQVKKIIDACVKEKIKVISSSQTSDKGSRHEYFKNSSLICMNKQEALEINPSFEINEAQMVALSCLLNSKICVTLGSDGAVYYDEKQMTIHPSPIVDVVDTCGAGDSFLAALCSSPKELNIKFSNEWAAQSVTSRSRVPVAVQLE